MTALAPSPVETAPAPEKLLTADEYYALPGSMTEGTELINGRIVPKHGENQMSGPGAIHGKIVVRISGRMEMFATSASLGDVYTETGFLIGHEPKTLRRPDVAFVAAARLESGTPEEFFEAAPDLVVEVVSRNDRWVEVEGKTQLYLDHGTRLVWIVDPETRILTARTSDGASQTYVAHDEVSADSVLPGFVLRLREIWP